MLLPDGAAARNMSGPGPDLGSHAIYADRAIQPPNYPHTVSLIVILFCSFVRVKLDPLNPKTPQDRRQP